MSILTRVALTAIALSSLHTHGWAQSLRSFQMNDAGNSITGVTLDNEFNRLLGSAIPLFSFHLGEQLVFSDMAEGGDDSLYKFPGGISGTWQADKAFKPGTRILIKLENTSPDTLSISNVVPFGESAHRMYLTAAGPMALARAKIFRPGKGAIDVTLPDNAWEMGYGDLPVEDSLKICGIARRTAMNNSIRKRYSTILPPGSSVEYTLYADAYRGEWQDGMKLMFRDRYLYDLEHFDNTLYNRTDLQWIRSKYVMSLQAAWDHEFYDQRLKKYTVYQFLAEGKRLFGGYDVYGLWPTFPRLGLDGRNQFDLYADMPLGLDKLRELAGYARHNGTAFFISYNPWDKSTRSSDHYRSLAELIYAIGADGVVLDTRGASSAELQHAADSVRQGVIMYPEGMAVPRDMPGVVIGRVHDAIYLQSPLNLNRLIKPECSIFRVCQLSQGRIRRELYISFFNGHGTEINTFAPGRPSWIEEEYTLMGRTSRILRENTMSFQDHNWTPLIPGRKDSIWINCWQDRTRNKTLYTIFSLSPGGYIGPLFEAGKEEGFHWISLWNHEEVIPVTTEGRTLIPVNLEAFNRDWLKTRQEGSVECLARFPQLLLARLVGDTLWLKPGKGDTLKVWKGDPSYQNTALEFTAGARGIDIATTFHGWEGKIVIELFEKGELIDERVIETGEARIREISSVTRTDASYDTPEGMIEIPGSFYTFRTQSADGFIPYPGGSDSVRVKMAKYYIDRYPVTNEQFYQFLAETGYKPADGTNFLKHWSNNIYPRGQEDYPVVWINLEDAHAYTRWAGKRIPTEMEWQYAAQGVDGRKFPWGMEFHGTKCNNVFGQATPVDAFPKGKSPFGVEDLVGNVWQLTNDEYDNGSYSFVIIKGGCFYKPDSSTWYLEGGPQPVDRRQMLLRVSPGFDRSETVGFRCVKDAVK